MAEFDRERVRAFAQRLMGVYADAMVANLIALGTRTGLLDALAALGEEGGTSGEVAAAAGLHERYVREWLHGMVTAGVVEHGDGRFSLPAEHAQCLVGGSFMNTTVMAEMAASVGGSLDRFEEVFRTGEGIPFHEQPGNMPGMMGRLSGARFDTFLVSSYLPSVPGLPERLAAGARVVDVGCGTGRVPLLIAQAFPASSVVGLDLSEPSIEVARKEAAALGLPNVSFQVGPVSSLEGGFDLVTTFDVVHDLGDPLGALRQIRSVLVEDGVYVMVDSGAPPTLEEQAELPWAPLMYGLSTFGCVGTARSQGGEGYGAMWGREAALALLAEAGFTDVSVHPVKGDPMDALYACHP